MPIYEYRCEACGHLHEELQKISDPHLTDCPACDKAALKRLISKPSFRLKGAGWYETDFKSDKERKRNLVDGGDGKAATDGGGGDSAKADSKPAGESKAADPASGGSASSGDKPSSGGKSSAGGKAAGDKAAGSSKDSAAKGSGSSEAA